MMKLLAMLLVAMCFKLSAANDNIDGRAEAMSCGSKALLSSIKSELTNPWETYSNYPAVKSTSSGKFNGPHLNSVMCYSYSCPDTTISCCQYSDNPCCLAQPGTATCCPDGCYEGTGDTCCGNYACASGYTCCSTGNGCCVDDDDSSSSGSAAGIIVIVVVIVILIVAGIATCYYCCRSPPAPVPVTLPTPAVVTTTGVYTDPKYAPIMTAQPVPIQSGNQHGYMYNPSIAATAYPSPAPHQGGGGGVAMVNMSTNPSALSAPGVTPPSYYTPVVAQSQPSATGVVVGYGQNTTSTYDQSMAVRCD